MTDKSAAAVREFIFQHLSSYDEWGYTFEKPGSVEALTALISEHYVAKEKYDKLLQQRDELLKTMKSIYCTTDASDQNSMQHAIYRIGAAIKNTDTK